ncbi:hypothetical protein N510_003262 [Firmicutes bacterium ASF500]|nr:hypothetical protein N510_003262 [Firmicutes bacterium ASF500]
MEQRNAAPGEQLPQLDGIAQNAKAEDFRMKNKVYEIIKYGNICLKDFPRYERNGLALDIRQCEYAILRHVITLENKHYKRSSGIWKAIVLLLLDIIILPPFSFIS